MTDALLKNLTDLSRRLNEGSDLVSQRIAQLETALNELKLGVTTWVNVSIWTEMLDEPSGQTIECEKSLGYLKYKGKWGLVLSEGHPALDDHVLVFLRDASRDDRVEAVEKLPLLIKQLETEARKLDKKVTDSAKTIESMIKAMGQSRQAGSPTPGHAGSKGGA